jgi:gliding motility-associated-like protein
VYGLPHQLFSSGGRNYYWTPSSPLNNPFAQNPLATLYNDTRFTVLVTDDIGCSNTDDVFIKVYKGPTYYLPNAFTPNGDGVNDIFKPIPVGISLTQYFSIYNRNGELVYQGNQWLKGWDGMIKGKPASAGTYVWMIKGIDRNGKTVEKSGTVILIH